MAKLIMMIGLSGSGKTTKSRSLYENKTDKTIRLNKDLLREMLHFGEYSKDNEKEIKDVELILAERFLLLDYTVIIDDTNLTEEYRTRWTGLADATGSSFLSIHIDTPVEECIKRDSKRERSVGEKVILKQLSSLDNLFNKE